MSKVNLGLFTTPTGGQNYGYWDTKTGVVYVGGEEAGVAADKEEAWRKANFYSTTRQKMK